MSEEQERRGANRVKIHLDVTFTANGGPPMVGSVENLSRNGMLLVAAIAVAAGTRLRITFSDPAHHARQTIEGEVVRSAAAGKFGVSFVETDEAGLTFVRTLVGATA